MKIWVDIDGKTRYKPAIHPKFENEFKVYTLMARRDLLSGAPDPIGEDGESDAAGQEHPQGLCIEEVTQGEG